MRAFLSYNLNDKTANKSKFLSELTRKKKKKKGVFLWKFSYFPTINSKNKGKQLFVVLLNRFGFGPKYLSVGTT